MNPEKRALITGITGQDGSYLAELLLAKGYVVHGILRRASAFNRSRIEHLRSDKAVYGSRLFLHYADLTDVTTLRRIISSVQPDEMYHLAGQSHVGLSFEIPESTCHETGSATLSLLEICRDQPRPPRFYHASSAEVFGTPGIMPQDENTPFRPVNPYGCAKVFATNLCQVYRTSHRLFICNGIAYNHESPQRSENFVTRKIVAAAARMARGSQEVLELGNLSSARDWGYAPEYVDAMWRILQADQADDYVLATGTLTTVREFAVVAFAAAGIAVRFEGRDLEEVARDQTGRVVVRVASRFFRPVESVSLVGNPAKARMELGWSAATVGQEVANKMVQFEMQRTAAFS